MKFIEKILGKFLFGLDYDELKKSNIELYQETLEEMNKLHLEKLKEYIRNMRG